MSNQEEMSLKKPSHVSYSQVSDFARCPFLWYVTRVVGIPQGSSRAATRGIVVHACIDRYCKWILEGNEPNMVVLKDILYDVIKDPKICPFSIVDDDVNICLKLLSDSFHSEAFDFRYTMSSEFQFSIPYHTKNLVGRIDRIDMKEGATYLIDYKTGYYLPDSVELLTNLEFNIYAYVVLKTPAFQSDQLVYKLINLTNSRIINVVCDMDVVLSKMEYVKSIIDAMDRYTEFKRNPGEACTRFGGCMMANVCVGEIIKKLDKDNPLGEVHKLEDHEIITLVANLTKVNSSLRKRLKEMLTEFGDVKGVSLSPRKVTVQNDGAIRQFLDLFDVDPCEFMKIDTVKFHKVVARIGRELQEDTSDNSEFLMSALADIEQCAYNYIEGSVDLKFSTEKDADE